MEFKKTLSEILEKQIKIKFHTIKNFSDVSSVPYMTILSVIKRGVENTTIGTLQKICTALGISIVHLYRLQALDTIQFKLLNPSYSDDDLIADLEECCIIQKTYYTQDDKTRIAQNIRYALSDDWI